LAVAAGAALSFGGAASAQTDCYEHEPYFNDGPGGHGTATDVAVKLNPFNPAWQNAAGTRHWESITLRGEDGTWFTQDHPPAGVYQLPGGEKLASFQLCKGDEVDTPATTTVAATTTTVTATTSPAPVVPGQSTTTTSTAVAPAAPEIDLTQAARLPETGSSTWGLVGAAGMLVGIGWTLLRIRRSPV
jgi:LPXTG-motif cell wall-anchored protein